MQRSILSTTLALAGAATLALGFTAASAQAQTMYSMGATGANGTTGFPGGTGQQGTPALDLSAPSVITAGIYTGGSGGAGGNGAPGFNPNGGAGGPGAAAVQAESGSTVTITGGKFNFGLGGAGGAAAVGGGTPGSAGPNGYTLLDNGGAITLFGTFTGGPRTLATGTGTFTGTLSDGGAQQTFTYNLNAGSITLAASPAPEPGTWALLGAGFAGLGVVTLRRRRAAVRA